MKCSRGDTTGFPDAATVALVGFEEAEEISLRRILECSDCPMAPDCKWNVQAGRSVDSTIRALRGDRISVVLCDRDLLPAAWKELLELFAGMTRAPLLVVTSRLADERLWAEALNLGAYDVLARPFDDAEVVRTISMAWLSWKGRRAFAGVASSVA